MLACGGGSSSSGPENGDSSADGTGQPPVDSSTDSTADVREGGGGGGGDGGEAAAGISVVASDLSVYVSQVAALDASASTGPGTLTYAWSLTSAPSGSGITSQSLLGATTAKPTFAPDVKGDFVLQVTVTSGGQTASKTVTVHAFNGHVFYTTTKADDNTPYFEYDVVQMDGTGPHSVACRSRTLATRGDAGVVTAEAGAGTGQNFLLLSAQTADISLDSWEGPAGTPARGAFGQFETTSDASTSTIDLLSVTSDTTCQTVPAPVHTVTGSAPSIIQPHFSPDGSRIAYVEQRDSSTYHIATIGFDGTDYHDLGTLCGGIDAGQNCSASNGSYPARPQWKDATHVTWIADLGSGSFSFITAADTNNTTPTVAQTCVAAVSPRGFAYLKDGSIVANYNATGSKVEDLVVFGAASTNCTVARNLTKLTAVGAYARDFAVSPDGANIAYIQFNPPAGYVSDAGAIMGGSIYMVPTDGSSVGYPVGGTQRYAFYGPRFISGGTHLAWNGDAPPPPDASASLLSSNPLAVNGNPDATAPSMNVELLDGGNLVYAAQSDLNNELYIFGGGNGGGCSFSLCSAVPGRSPLGTGGMGMGSVLGLLLLRRRNRRQG
jgi:hypothetical protein